MKLKKTALSTAVLVALGLGGMAVGPVASATVLQNNTYRATINPTPYTASAQFTASGAPTDSALIVPKKTTWTTTNGEWNSTFSFSHLPSKLSEGMVNNGVDVNCGPNLASSCGSSSAARAGAGSWLMKVTGGTFTTSHFQVDAVFTTAGGTFVQYGSVNGGTIDQTTGAMALNTTGRLGAVGNFGSALYNEPWNIPDGGTTYAPLSTSSSANPNGLVYGHGITSNGDGTYDVVLVSASAIGSAWGNFDTNPYVETWDVTLAPVPIPAAAWLFGSGLIGLVGIARRKKSS